MNLTRPASTSTALLHNTTFHKTNTDRHLVCKASQAHPSRFLRNATDLVKNRAWLDHSRPKLGFAFSLTHSGLEGN
jgi:hypothetical protein